MIQKLYLTKDGEKKKILEVCHSWEGNAWSGRGTQPRDAAMRCRRLWLEEDGGQTGLPQDSASECNSLTREPLRKMETLVLGIYSVWAVLYLKTITPPPPLTKYYKIQTVPQHIPQLGRNYSSALCLAVWAGWAQWTVDLNWPSEDWGQTLVVFHAQALLLSIWNNGTTTATCDPCSDMPRNQEYYRQDS